MGRLLNTVADKHRSVLISVWAVNLKGKPCDLVTAVLLINVAFRIFFHLGLFVSELSWPHQVR